MCNNQAPWGVSTDLAYGYAAVRISGLTEKDWCCACYELTFTSGAASGKKMVIQATNTGGDLGENHFDIASKFCSVKIINTYSVLLTRSSARRWCWYLQWLQPSIQRSYRWLG